jgi:hypothetical protein
MSTLNKALTMKFFLILSLLISGSLFAQDLVINGAEFGIGKFHRKDNKQHKYETNNAWKVFVLPEGTPTSAAYVQKNSETNYTIFFTSLEEFLQKIVDLSTQTGKKVGIINLNAHGLPGGMWFPSDAHTRDSFECMSWKKAASSSDDENYKQYYSAVSKEEMQSFDQMSNSNKIPSYQCLTGVKEWTKIVAKVPAIKSVFSDDAQIHMLSCIVGMGTLGDAYTTGLAKLLFDKPVTQQVQTSIKFGLGDWSMPEGMGFWGYENDDQLRRDNEVYPVHKRDFEIMQHGSIRVAQVAGARVRSGLINEQEYIYLSHDDRPVVFGTSLRVSSDRMNKPLPRSIRVPGTKVILKLK